MSPMNRKQDQTSRIFDSKHLPKLLVTRVVPTPV